MRSYGGTDFGSDEVVGVLAGYYFGAGLMVKPSVVEGVGRATAQLAGGCFFGGVTLSGRRVLQMCCWGRCMGSVYQNSGVCGVSRALKGVLDVECWLATTLVLV
jgi:hypothetical protein